MVEEFVSPTEFERALSDIKDSIDNLRSEIREMKEKFDKRLDNFEERRQTDLQGKIQSAYSEGVIQGRIQALENRLDRQEQWRLATIAPGLVALGIIIFEWFKGGK